ncbi:hypothetical protein BYT27DRAFT_7101610 [Phlegmacium glaucopus]|nr:hypothetical protein BYT27DRAFT_7101610 [Phlegmacium glaucopus]
MKAFIAVIITFACIAASGAANVPLARRSEEAECAAVCLTVEPSCPSGQTPSGSAGCWGCCQ